MTKKYIRKRKLLLFVIVSLIFVLILVVFTIIRKGSNMATNRFSTFPCTTPQGSALNLQLNPNTTHYVVFQYKNGTSNSQVNSILKTVGGSKAYFDEKNNIIGFVVDDHNKEQSTVDMLKSHQEISNVNLSEICSPT